MPGERAKQSTTQGHRADVCADGVLSPRRPINQSASFVSSHRISFCSFYLHLPSFSDHSLSFSFRMALGDGYDWFYSLMVGSFGSKRYRQENPDYMKTYFFCFPMDPVVSSKHFLRRGKWHRNRVGVQTSLWIEQSVSVLSRGSPVSTVSLPLWSTFRWSTPSAFILTAPSTFLLLV